MAKQSTPKTAVVVPNWNGITDLPACLDSLQAQSYAATIIVVENGSVDGSVEFIEENYPKVVLLKQPKNLGFAGGVNVGIRHAIEHDYSYVALFNNDAVAEKDWLKNLVHTLEENSGTGIATCKLVNAGNTHIDSTGDIYTVWGLPYPRGRGETISEAYDEDTAIFGASGGASLYRISMLEQIGLFDEKFFAYYEDVDISFRAQLAGWKILYAPQSTAYHQISATGGKIKGFATHQTMKNLPILLWKNIPLKYAPVVFPRLFLAYWLMVASAFTKGNGISAIKGNLAWLGLIPHTYRERRRIQKSKTVSDEYIWSIITHDLPPNAYKLRALRARWRKFTTKSVN